MTMAQARTLPIRLPGNRAVTGSGEVDVPSDPRLTRAFNQFQQAGTLCDSGSPSDEDHNSRVWLRFGKSQKIVPVTGHQNQRFPVGVPQHIRVFGGQREDVAKTTHFVPGLPQHHADRVRHIVVEKKLHGAVSGKVICSATSASISALWSS